MSDNTGGLAFPQPMAATPTGEMYCAVEKHPDFGGMTLRDYFAAKAMQGILANPNKDYFVGHLVGEAYIIADAMLAEREKE